MAGLTEEITEANAQLDGGAVRGCQEPGRAGAWAMGSVDSRDLPGTAISIQGAIDRLDLRAASGAVRVTDYKTGKPPQSSGTDGHCRRRGAAADLCMRWPAVSCFPICRPSWRVSSI